jgi:type II secretory pathway pseudopilin PulG
MIDSSESGAALIDLVVTSALMVVMAAVAIPTLQATRQRDAARMASRFLAQRLQMLRIEAVRRNRNVALRFDPDDPGRISTYVDGDGDGVLERDIEVDVDTIVIAESRLSDYFGAVSLRVAATVPAPDGIGTVLAGSDPVRIGNTNLLSFSPLGSATSGTIYLAAQSGPQMCVRILGTTGRVRVMWFDAASGTWRRD